jgi:hypothetical protein
MAAPTITASSFVLNGTSAVAATVTYDSSTGTATLTPSAPLAASTTYTATVKATVTDTAGNALGTDYTWTFTTGAPTACPCSIWPASPTPANPSINDSGDYELGVRFSSDVDGLITAIRFYKGTGNGGTHVGHLWTSTGALLGSVTFTGESTTGWQQATFATPIAITAGQVYVASYYAPQGHYAADRPYFTLAGVDSPPLHALAAGTSGNGVYSAGGGFPTASYQSSNYWVDVVFATSLGPDTTPPTVSSTTPASGATGVATTTSVSARFSEAMAAGTITSSTVFLKDGSGTTVPATVAYDSGTNSAKLTPNAALAASTTYTATVKGTVTDAAGNALGSDSMWSFTTGAPLACPCSIWPATAAPANPSSSDTNSYELGVRFTSDVNGVVNGIRFYKGTGNGGTHVGHLWTASGLLLGTVTFTGETTSGWQEADFATPIATTAGQVYIASYFDPQGHYAADRPYFTLAGVDRPPLHALADGPSGPNGVYSNGGGFPTSSYQSSNYWVDLSFSPTG